jgi:hypothetical protein
VQLAKRSFEVPAAFGGRDQPTKGT